MTAYASGTNIGQATCGEGGSLRNNTAGDQSGGEVSVSKWGYGSGAYHWEYVFRAKDKKLAMQLAQNMIDAANNNYIGYDQKSPDRNSFYDEAKKKGWNISAIDTKCETTCSSAISVCLNAAGVKVPRTWYSEIMYKDIVATGQFDCFTSKDFVASDKKLLPGDILISPGHHAAMVVESSNKYPVDVTYETQDKPAVDEKEYGTTITLYTNDGKQPKSMVLEEDIDLSAYEPAKNGYTFEYWSNDIDQDKYTAVYHSNFAPIYVKGKMKKIEN